MIIIGEKINGTIPSTCEAITERNRSYIADMALKQSEAGATYIDVCASTSPETEVETLKWLIEIVQEITETPICVDSPSAQAIKEALCFVNKPGLINSVSLEGNKVETIFPLIADTKWECVALLCDNKGIPSSVERRLEIAWEIIKRAGEYGISPDRLHIDPLVMALSTDGASMTKFMDCCREIKGRHPEIHITSGLSNISFGLPVRKTLNQAFLTLAMSVGMDCAIMDPLNRDMMAALLATDALLERDKHCRKFTTAYRKGRIGPQK